MAQSAGGSSAAQRVAIVTGAAQGIGAAIARRLAADGHRVVVADLNDEKAGGVAAEIDGLGAHVDVSDPDSVQALIALVVERYGRIDILVNNAAVQPFAEWEEITFDDWRRVMAVNVDGLFLMTRAVYPEMVRGGYGRIVNITSNTFVAGTPHFAHYVASKGASIGFTRSLAGEIGKHGITINAVAPGLTATEGVLGGGHGDDFDFVVPAQAVPRRAMPQDIAPAVAFLASEDAAWVTGQTLVVDGGHTRN